MGHGGDRAGRRGPLPTIHRYGPTSPSVRPHSLAVQALRTCERREIPQDRGRKRFQWPLLFWYLTREVPSIYGGGLYRMCSKATQAGAKALYEKIEADILAEYGAVSQEEK